MAMLIQEILQQPDVISALAKEDRGGYDNSHIKKKRVFLFGTGASLSACMQAKYAFLKYADVIPHVVAAFEAPFYLKTLLQEDLVIIISQSGESYETKVICEELQKNNIPFWGITNNPESFLGKEAIKCFALGAGEELGTATKTQTASVMVLYKMAIGNNTNGKKQLAELSVQMRESIDLARAYVDELIAFIGRGDRLYLAGLDEQAPTALQASLMIKEKVWLHAEGMSLAEFRHGPVEVLGKGIPIILIGHGEEKLKTLLCHANFLKSICHAEVALVTNCQCREIDGFPNFPYCFEGDEELSQICATVPFQVLAERMAYKRNYDIDGFKYIGKILNQYEKPIEK